MMKYHKSVLETIGNTPLIQLRKSVEGVPGLILGKVETFNPWAFNQRPYGT